MGWGLSCALFQIPNLTGPSSWWEQVSQGSGKSLGTKRLSGGRMCLLRLASNLKGLSWRWRHRVQFLKFFFFFFNQDWTKVYRSINQPANQSITSASSHPLPPPPTQPCLPWETSESAPGPCEQAFCSDDLVSTRVPGAEGTAPPSLSVAEAASTFLTCNQVRSPQPLKRHPQNSSRWGVLGPARGTAGICSLGLGSAWNQPGTRPCAAGVAGGGDYFMKSK